MQDVARCGTADSEHEVCHSQHRLLTETLTTHPPSLTDIEIALRDYEPRVINYTDQLLCQIQATAGRPINVTDWFNFYSFDVMGDLAFGKSFNMLKDGVKHYFVRITFI